MAIADDLLGVTVSLAPGRVTLGVSGEMDSYTAGALHDAATTAMEPDLSLVVDMAEVTFIDSVGLGTLVRIARMVKESEGDFHLQGPSASVTRLLEITGLTGALPLEQTT